MAKAKSTKKTVVPKKIELTYHRAEHFRSVYADGNLIRGSSDGQHIVLTFFEEDRELRSQEAVLVTAEGNVGTYKPGPIDEAQIRTIQVSVRMTTTKALELVQSVLDRVNQMQPGALRERGFEFRVDPKAVEVAKRHGRRKH